MKPGRKDLEVKPKSQSLLRPLCVEKPMSLINQAKNWWQQYTGEEETPLDGDTPAWAVSLMIHVVVLLSLALVGLGQLPKTDPKITITSIAAEDVLEPAQAIAISDNIPETIGAQSEQSIDMAEAIAPVFADVSVVPVTADDSVSDIQLDLSDALPTGQQMDANVVVKGASGVGTTGASGAVDRLTAEIARSLEERPTLVCWVFDQSVSLSAQRKEISSRLDRVFEELGANRSKQNRPELSNIVVAFGKTVTLITQKLTDEVDDVVKAIDSIPVDESGAEMTFTAIGAAANFAKVHRTNSPRKNVMIIVFTDEVGNDQPLADQTAVGCRALGIPVYVVGVPAPFGQRDVKTKFVEFDPRYDSDVQWAVVEQGPETLYPEVVRVRSGNAADEPIDSGFGPFSLSKLCGNTGGIYFCVHANRNAEGRVSDNQTAAMSSQLRYFFKNEAMREYQPDYVSSAQIDQMLEKNIAKKALVKAAQSSELSPMDSPTMTFPRQDDGKLAQLLGEAQKKAAVLEPKITTLYNLLLPGVADREKIKEKRWQAGYDLAMGRVIALKVRTEAYNLMLAQAKSGMKFKDATSDTWQLRPSSELSVGSQTDKLAKQATMYLERVVKDHPGTPWAHLAALELRNPLGYVWDEKHTGVNDPPKPAGGGGGNPPPPNDNKKMLAPPKMKRPIKNI